jgi:hypothetical protein
MPETSSLSRRYEETRKRRKEGRNEGTGYNNNKNTAKNFNFIIYTLKFFGLFLFLSLGILNPLANLLIFDEIILSLVFLSVDGLSVGFATSSSCTLTPE